jgi:hypothetical protein
MLRSEWEMLRQANEHLRADWGDAMEPCDIDFLMCS